MTIGLIQEDNPNIKFNPFSGYLPKPNWRLTYNGLARVPGLDKIFTNFSISDGYTSTLSMNSFNSNLNFQDPFGIRQPGFIDTLTGNFVPYFMVPNITISEQFAPLIDLDMQFVNQLQAKFSFSKSRQLSLSLIDYQMSESPVDRICIWSRIPQTGSTTTIQNQSDGKKRTDEQTGKRSDPAIGHEFPRRCDHE